MKAIPFAVLLLVLICGLSADVVGAEKLDLAFPTPLESYQDDGIDSIMDKLVGRVKTDPFNLIATLIFFCAIGHTFLASTFNRMAHHYEEEHREKHRDRAIHDGDSTRDSVSFKATLFHFLGEVEAIFGIWLLPLFAAIFLYHDWSHVTHLVQQVHYIEPIFVVVIMAVASTKPVIRFSESFTRRAADWMGGSVAAWWFVILTLLPLLGSFITEPAAMTIAALLLSGRIYALEPSNRLKYATLGALFVAISVGGTLTHFAAPPVLMVASRWDLGTVVMATHVGWKAVAAIVFTNVLLYFVFRKELASLQQKATDLAARRSQHLDEPMPGWIIVMHLLFLGWTVFTLHYTPLVVGGFLFFLAFTKATEHHQYQLSLRTPVLVGFFLAGLVTHGAFQGWWIQPVLSGLGQAPLFIGSTLLTAVNDNAAITYLASLVPSFDAETAADPARALALQYAVLTGAVTGGGLTVIANAPNPAGQSVLGKHFEGGIHPLGLLAGAIAPTLIVALFFQIAPSF
jgi:Na+/H+ antiporter NhaD/arsenite permease-like protein